MKKLFTFIFAAALAVSCWGTEIQIGEITSTKSTYVPLVSASTSRNSISQLLYLSSELTDKKISNGTISAISFYYVPGSGDSEKTRSIEVWVDLVSKTYLASSEGSSKWFYENSSSAAGTKYFDGSVKLPTTEGWYTITLESGIVWDSSKSNKNIVITVNDKTNAYIVAGSRNHRTYTTSDCRALYTSKGDGAAFNASNTHDISGSSIKQIPVIRFTFAGGDKPAAPTNVQSSNITYNSADISWTGVDGADSYSLQYKKSGASSYTTINNIAATSYSLSGLDASTTYVFGVKTVKGSESSDFTADANFTTLAEPAHTHNDITFTKWTETNSLPKSGNYYLENNVSMSNTWEIDGTLNLCLNGQTINLNGNYANIDQEVTIFDCAGLGKITSTNASYGTLSVFSGGGSLTLNNCSIENTGSGDYATAVKVNGSASFYMNGAVKLNATNADIYLYSTGSAISFTATKKPSQPTSPYSIYRLSGVLTNGWSNMGDVDPADYFVSANSSYSIAKNASGELELASSVIINETSTSNPIQSGSTANVTLNRTLVADGFYSTICLPFAVSKELIEDQFGAGTIVQKLSNASLSDNDTELTLTFDSVTTMEAGKPYLIKPAKGGSSFTFNNVTLDNTDRSYESTNLDFIGTFDQINLTVGNKNTLLLGGNDKLGWAETSGTFKGLRAYFLVKYHGASAPASVSARMVFNNATKIQEIQSEAIHTSDVHKFVYNGQLIIIRNGAKYNAQGVRL